MNDEKYLVITSTSIRSNKYGTKQDANTHLQYFREDADQLDTSSARIRLNQSVRHTIFFDLLISHLNLPAKALWAPWAATDRLQSLVAALAEWQLPSSPPLPLLLLLLQVLRLLW